MAKVKTGSRSILRTTELHRLRNRRYYYCTGADYMCSALLCGIMQDGGWIDGVNDIADPAFTKRTVIDSISIVENRARLLEIIASSGKRCPVHCRVTEDSTGDKDGGRSKQANCWAAQLILNNRMSKSLRRYGRNGRSDWLQHQGGGGGSRRQARYRLPHLGTKQDSLPQSRRRARSVRTLKVSSWPTVAGALRPTVSVTGTLHLLLVAWGRGKKTRTLHRRAGES
ncbi:hypothetical protein GGI43DRAFT_11490 [Trichoderma evansii]